MSIEWLHILEPSLLIPLHLCLASRQGLFLLALATSAFFKASSSLSATRKPAHLHDIPTAPRIQTLWFNIPYSCPSFCPWALFP